MHKKITVSFLKVLISLSLMIVFAEGMTFATGSGVSQTNSLQHFVDSGKLPPGIQKKIEESGAAKILLILDDSDIKDLARQMRETRGLKHDDSTIIAEKARLYKNRKKAVLSKVSPGKYKLLKDYNNFPVVFLDVDKNALVSLLNMTEVSYVSEDKAFGPHLVESLPLIRAPQAHLVGATGSGTSVAVLDTGLDYTLAAFGSCTGGSTPGNCTDVPPPAAPEGCNVVCVHDFAPDDGKLDALHHGTNVSGIIAGVAPDTGILGLDVFDGSSAYTSTILDALDWVVANQAAYNIVAVNMSFGSGRSYEPCPGDGMASAIAGLKSAGITSVVSSGNDGYTDSISSPACVAEAVSVGAVYDSDMGSIFWSSCHDLTTAADKVTCFSNSASFLTMLAPGAVIDAAGFSMGGTSQAAPHVSGAVAIAKGQDNLLSVDEVISRLTSTGVSVLDTRNSITKPRVDLYDLVSIISPIIGMSPSTFSFTGAEGGQNPSSQVLGVTNDGSGTLNWSASSSAGWLSPAPPNGTGAGDITLSIDTTGLTSGTYNANITITAAGALNSPVTVPVTLEIKNAAYSEDFETGNLTKFPWETGGNGPWTIEDTTLGGISHTGRYSARSAAITDNQSTYLQVTLNVTSQGYLYFWVKTSTEPTWDKIKFYVDGFNEGLWNGWSGTTDWTFVASENEVSAGIHTFKWEYEKDVNTTVGSDVVWLDDIFFPPSNTLVPMTSVSPLSKAFGSVPVGGTAVQTFTVSNTGTGDLIIGTVAFTGTDVSQFTKENDTCSGHTVVPAGSCTLDVKFTPSSTGAKSASLSISANYPATTTAALSGTGFPRYTLMVNKDGSTGFGTVTSAPSGIHCGLDCTEIYDEDTVVTLTAAQDSNSTFSGWSGGGCSGTGTCEVTMTGDQTVIAVFAIRPPVAAFSESTTTGEAPLAVNFSDLTTNNPTAWSWDFGVSGTSSQQNPLHTFRTAGTYSVTLTASNASGSHFVTKTAYINVSECGNDPVRISGSDLGTSIQTVYNNEEVTIDGAVINTQAVDFIEDLTLARPITITLAGGYNCAYTANPSDTAIHGFLTISDGTVIIENISIQ